MKRNEAETNDSSLEGSVAVHRQHCAPKTRTLSSEFSLTGERETCSACKFDFFLSHDVQRLSRQWPNWA